VLPDLRPARRLARALALAALAGCATIPPAPPLEAPQARPIAPLARKTPGAPALALVLGGGASRGFAHVGVIEELERAGYNPRIVVGTSAGSFVGALYAGGYDGKALRRIADKMTEEELRVVIVPDRGFLSGVRLRRFIDRHLRGRTIEQLPRRFAAVATDLRTGAAVAFNHGDPGIAVQASSAIPGVFQPVRIGGRDYVDGGLASPVPVRTARLMGADVVVAIDVSRRPEYAGALDSEAAVIMQAVAIMEHYVGRDERRRADVLIVPDVSRIGTLDFAHRDLAIQAGARAARAALPAIRQAIERASRIQ
jgi:NTE family protein